VVGFSLENPITIHRSLSGHVRQDRGEYDIVIVSHNIDKREDGQAMVEFAIVVPILLVLVLGIIQFGIVFNHHLTLTDAVRAGARQAAVSRTLSSQAAAVAAAEARVRSAASGSLSDAANPVALPVTVTPYDPVSGQAKFVQGGDVTVTARYHYDINLLGLVVRSGWLISETTERVE
jgi:Flp pilus assembly protein TadG